LLEREQVRALRRAGWTGQVVIDVGCGHGGFLNALGRHSGLAEGSYGVEITSESVEAAHEWYGLDVRPALGEVPAGAFVTMWHSAEHFDVAELRAVLARARAGGGAKVRLLVSVPSVDSWQWRLVRTRWAYYDADAHRSQFSRTSLDLLCAQAGFEPVARPRIVLYELFGALQSLINMVRPHNRLYERIKRGQAVTSKRALGIDVALAALAVVPAGVLALAGLVVSAKTGCQNVVYEARSVNATRRDDRRLALDEPP
jgi:hypothetical protein